MAVALSPNYAVDGVVAVAGGTFGANSGGTFVGRSALLSRDGGDSWKNLFAGGGDMAIVFSPMFAEDHMLFLATSGAALERVVIDQSSWSWDSEDLHTRETEQLSCDTFFVNDVAVSPSYDSDRTIFLANNSYGLCKSTDDGATWTKLTDDISVDAVAVSPAYADDSTVEDCRG